jgi:RNA polymerase sigma-B factor
MPYGNYCRGAHGAEGNDMTTSQLIDGDTVESTALIEEYATLPADSPRRAAVRDRAIESWLPLARRLAHRYGGRGEPLDDLIQVACIGMIKAIDRFDATRGIDFAGFAIPTVVGEIRRHFRDRTWAVRPPRRLQELRLAITAANTRLTQQLGHPPTAAEVAADLEVTEEEVLEGLEGARAYSCTSLSTPMNADGSTSLGDTMGDEDDGYALAEARVTLGPALARLPERERKIIIMRFYGNMTQSEIAEQLGLSQMHISRLIRRALSDMKFRMHA